uniref:Uncharacterized protein n=1 Tax=Rhizophora mucronata TaxID=61149 RepID=A0A2P2R0V6_RHIMU
MASEIPSLLAA